MRLAVRRTAVLGGLTVFAATLAVTARAEDVPPAPTPSPVASPIPTPTSGATKFAVRATAEPFRDVLRRFLNEAKASYRLGPDTTDLVATVTIDLNGVTVEEGLDRIGRAATVPLTFLKEGETYVVIRRQALPTADGSQETPPAGGTTSPSSNPSPQNPAPLMANAAQGDVPEYFRARRISDADLAKKKEGQFLTFLPDISSDPVYGNGVGLRANLFWNGNRSDSRFAYTPYVAKLTFNAFVTDRDAQEFAASLDMPYFKGSRFRLKADLKVGQNPNNLYFGITERTLGKLTLPDGRQFDKYDDFDKARDEIRPGGAGGPGEASLVTDALSNRFNEKEIMLNLKADYAVGDGKLKVMGGYEIQRLDYTTFSGRRTTGVDPVTGEKIDVPNGNSVLEQDALRGIARGLDGGIVSILQQALIYDTRDFEPDPTKGIYLELANEYSSPLIGSQFTFDKLFAQAKIYKKLPFGQRTIFAGRLATGNIFGDEAPFFEYQDQWSPDGSINSLGGSETLRGYVANRFLARAVFFANAELRYRVGETRLLGQRFALNVVPFLDLGTVRDNWFDFNLDRIQSSYGTGFRIAWNQSTVIAADFGFSKEGRQFFLGIGSQF